MSITKHSEDYDEKYMKTKLNSGGILSLNKLAEIPTIAIVVRAIFNENQNYYPKVFLDECIYKI